MKNFVQWSVRVRTIVLAVLLILIAEIGRAHV